MEHILGKYTNRCLLNTLLNNSITKLEHIINHLEELKHRLHTRENIFDLIRDEKNITLDDLSTYGILSNFYKDKVDSRIVEILEHNGNYYTYANNSTNRVSQLTETNIVSLLLFRQEGSAIIQTLLSGKLEKLTEIDNSCPSEKLTEVDNLVVYKFIVEHKKITKTTVTKKCLNYCLSSKYLENDKELNIKDKEFLNCQKTIDKIKEFIKQN